MARMSMAIGGLVIFMLIFMALMFAVGILIIIAEWKIFKKAGQPGWAAIVPFYNFYVLCKITWGNGWLFLLALLPFGGLLFLIFTYIKLAHVFGKGGGYAAGLVFFPYIFMPILGFGRAEYCGTDQKNNKGFIIATAVLGGVGIIAMVISIAASVILGIRFADTDPALYEDYYDEYYDDSYDDSYDDLYDDSYNDSYDDGYLDEEDDFTSDYGDDIVTTPVEGSEYFVNVTLDDGETSVQVPVPESEYMSVSGSVATSIADGITTSLYIGYSYDGYDLAQMVSDTVETRVELYEEMPEYYTNITVDEIINGDGYALQQINYDYISWDDELYPCFEIVKCDLTGDAVVWLDLTVDNSSATENTQAVFEEACELYGIDFDFD